jgi:hypothetical protein
MKQIDSSDILKRIEERRAHDHHVDERLIYAVKRARNLFLFTVHDEASFLSLIWHERSQSRLLTPRGQPRTLADVAGRMIENRWTFSSLCCPMSLPAEDEHDPSWFRSCKRIDAEFSFDEFDFIGLMPANDCERRQSPGGKFYIYDGAHKTLVLAYRLLAKQTAFRTVEGLLIAPRLD